MLFCFTLLVQGDQQYVGFLFMKDDVTRMPRARIERRSKQFWNVFA